ncbi:MAG: hypothetical protein ACM3X1_07180 [Ignavibacteriales bacterium]
MPNRITKLFMDTETFADKWVRTRLNDMEFYVIHLPLDSILITNGRLGQLVKEGEYTGTLIFAPRNQFSSWEDAFVGVFKKHVYHWESWTDFYANDVSKEEMAPHLNNFWIPQYVNTNQIRTVNHTEYMKSFEDELIDYGVSKDFIEDLQDQITNLEIVTLTDQRDDQTVFGISDSLAFIYMRIINH